MQSENTTAAWTNFLVQSDRDMRRNDLTHGVTFEARPEATPRETVREYVTRFGWNGVAEAEVVRETKIPRSTVKRALREMVEDGEATVVHTLTRGRDASRRAVYYSNERRAVAFYQGDATNHDYARVEYTCGGGRKVHARAGAL